MNTTITLNQAANLIALSGNNVSYLLSGEPGVGKSAVLGAIAAQLPTHKPVYVEAQTLDLGDIQMPKMGDNAVRFVPNALFQPDSPNQPLIIMLDELGKAMRPVQNAFLRLLHERKLGEFTLPAGSIVFATTNLATDGVGDNLQAHAKNRVTQVVIGKPTSDEWLVWAAANGIAPEVMAWVHEYPHALASYTDESQADNPYIFNPRKQQTAFVSPRSLEKASYIVRERINFDPETVTAALAGTIGESAARDMQAFLSVADTLPRWGRIVTDPENSPVPDSAIAQSILALSSIQRIDAANLTPWLTYLPRLRPELQAMWASQAMRSSKAGIVATNRAFTTLQTKNSWMF